MYREIPGEVMKTLKLLRSDVRELFFKIFLKKNKKTLIVEMSGRCDWG